MHVNIQYMTIFHFFSTVFFSTICVLDLIRQQLERNQQREGRVGQ